MSIASAIGRPRKGSLSIPPLQLHNCKIAHPCGFIVLYRIVQFSYPCYFVYSSCMPCRSPLSALSIAFKWYLNIGSPEPPCIDLEDCLDLAIRKGKAVGETKPTESNRAIKATTCLHRLIRAMRTWRKRCYKLICVSVVAVASRIIADAITEGLLKPADEENEAKKFSTYIPYYA